MDINLLKEKLKSISPKGGPAYRLTRDQQHGAINLYTVSGSERLYLYDNIDARADAAKWARDNYSNCELIVILSAGLGYHISEMLKLLKPRQKIHVFEANLYMLKIAFERTDLAEVLDNDKIEFHFGIDIELEKPLANCFIRKQAILCFLLTAINTAPALWKRAYHTVDTLKIMMGYKRSSVTAEDVVKRYGFEVMSYGRRIVIIDFYLESHIIESFFANLELGFEILGCKVDHVSYSDYENFLLTNEKGHVYNLLTKCDFAMCCNNMGFFNIDVPIWSLCIDRPYHLHKFVPFSLEKCYMSWIDETDIKYADELYYPYNYNIFTAHGAEIDIDTSDIFTTERWLDVVISCNYDDENAQFEKFNQIETPFDNETKANIISEYEKGHDTWEAVITKITGCPRETLLEFMSAAAFELDNYMRFKKKKKVIDSLLNNGITVHLFGLGWENSDIINHPKLLFHGIAPYEAGRELLKHTKILINITPFYFNGSHERVFSSMMHGTLCIADYTEHLAKHFTDKKDIVFYDQRNLNALAEKIKYYLENDDERTAITKEAYQKVKQKHTWYHRAKEILDTFNATTKIN